MNKKILVIGGNQLNGKIINQTSKNATLPIIAGAILTDKKVYLENIPNLLDIDNMLKIMEDLGVKIEKNKKSYILDSSSVNKFVIDASLSKNLRYSIFMLGPMLARFKKVSVSYPGGCDIGIRPIDLHISGLKQLGVKIKEHHSILICDGSNMKAGEVHLDFASVGATENLMMSAIFLNGTTKIINSAKEPEIVDLQNFLNKIGCKISGAGTSEIIVEGVKKLKSVSYCPIGDRIVAGSYLIATAMCGGDIIIKNTPSNQLTSLTKKLEQAGCELFIKKDSIRLISTGKLKAVPSTETQIYPGFPTDLQAQFMAMQTVSNGVSTIVETIFENRYRHAGELIKMGANIRLYDRVAIINGVENLNGAPVEATDLRGGASLVLAGLKAKGYTTIDNIYHIERGYEDIVKTLSHLGANIKYIE